MGLLERLRALLGLNQPAAPGWGQHQVGSAVNPMQGVRTVNDPNFLADDGWLMPKYAGRDICDWMDEIANLKRAGDLEKALEIALGCMDAMVQAALQNPQNVMEYYVKQVVVIQRKQKDYAGEVETIEGWLNLGIKPTREDHRLNLQKRLAKARELLARQRGEDPSEFHAQWQHLLALEKEYVQKNKSSVSLPSSGKSASSGRPSFRSRKRRGWVAPPEVLYGSSFVAVDFETANKLGGASACQIAVVKVVNGQVVDRANTLIKPPAGFDRFEFTYLHGIDARMVKPAPMWPDIAPWIAQFVGDLPVYAHNAAFDAGVWKDLDAFFGTRTLPDKFFCSYRTSEQLVPGLKNYKLPTVTKALVPGFKLNHHRADSDAEACALIIAALQSIR